jgi:hypothetical protein
VVSWGWHCPFRLLSPTGLAILGEPRLGEESFWRPSYPLQLTLSSVGPTGASASATDYRAQRQKLQGFALDDDALGG